MYELQEGDRFEPDPTIGQRLVRLQAAPAEVRVMLGRSFDSSNASEPSQDYLVVQRDRTRLAFAVTDGVGASFLGDVAAQLLASGLVVFLMNVQRFDDEGRFADELGGFLQNQMSTANDIVRDHPLPEGAKGIVREALESQ